MAKRSAFERVPKDRYRTFDQRAGAALRPFIWPGFRYVEPCAGDGDLICQLGSLGAVCVGACDLEPGTATIQIGDALQLKRLPPGTDAIITNPPWSRGLLHPMIRHFWSLGTAWLLFDAGWAFSQQAAPYLDRCSHIVAVGRLRWIEGTEDDSKDDCAWYRFDPDHKTGPHFHGRR